MAKVVLISCVSKKLSSKARAGELYISVFFKKCLRFAESLNPDRTFILSAKYGLVGVDEEIEPYDKTLNKMSKWEIEQWAERVLQQLVEVTDLKNDTFIILAGDKYRKYLLPHLNHYELPMENLSIGRQLQWLKGKVGNE